MVEHSVLKHSVEYKPGPALMSSKFTPPPAGAMLKPPTDVQSYYRRQLFARAPCTGASFVAGKECQFGWSASGNDVFVPQESRLVMKLAVRSNIEANGAAIGGSIPATHNRPHTGSPTSAPRPLRAHSPIACLNARKQLAKALLE